MTATFLFWAIASAIALASFAACLAPLLRGAHPAEPRARYDAKVFRDQLREIAADQRRGLVTEAEARATEIEISRRLLASAADEDGRPLPAPRRLSRGAGLALLAALLGAGLGLYARLGAPGLGDAPLGPRLEQAAQDRARRPSQAQAEAALAQAGAVWARGGPRLSAEAAAGGAAASREPAGTTGASPATPATGVTGGAPASGPRLGAAPAAPAAPSAPGPRVETAPGPAGGAADLELVDRLKAILKDRPDDARGHRLLARALSGLGDWTGARIAQGDVVRILGGQASADDYAEWAELMILATNGYVSPEAEGALGQALTRDPGNKLARYYSGLTLLQEGRPDLTYRLWTTLIAEGPPDAPWIPTIRGQIAEVARLAGLPPPAAADGAGPDAADVAAASRMAPEERQSMVEGMVDRLAARLASAGGSAEDWAELIRAQGVLGRTEAARASWQSAKARFAADPNALATVAEAARAAGVSDQ